MRKILLSILTLTSLSSHAQWCMTAGPTQTIDSNLEWLILNGASGSINFTGCPGVTGVQQYLAQTAYLNAGSPYTTTLQFGTCGGNYAGIGQAWIDFNQNGIFEQSETIGTWQGTPPTASSAFNFTVPGTATTGQTRMRVIQREGGTLPIDPCGSFTWGSCTDFSIYIQNGVNCSGYTGDNTADPRIVSTLPFSESHSTSVCYSSYNPVYASPDVYYLVLPNANAAALNISLCGSSFDTFLSVFDKDWNTMGINDDSPSCGLQSELQVILNGMDSVWVIVEGWGTNSGDYDISINQQMLGLDDLATDGNTVGLLPNPATDQFTIYGLEQGNFSISDARGSTVMASSFSSGNIIDISELSEGMYYVTITSDGVIKTLKLHIK